MFRRVGRNARRKGLLLGMVMQAGVLGCGGDDGSVQPLGAERSVYVGTAQGDVDGAQLLVGLVVESGQLRFLICGDQLIETTTQWVNGEVGDESGAEVALYADDPWQLDGELSGDAANGRLTGPVAEGDPTKPQTFTWQAERLPPYEPSNPDLLRPGVYSDCGSCETGVIVPSSGNKSDVQGSYCAAEYRAQVTPLKPVATGIRVLLPEWATELSLRPMAAAACR